MQKAAIPMLLSMVVGIAAMIAGAGEAGMVMMGAGQAMAQAQFAQFSRVQESTADQIAMQLLLATHQSPQGIYDTFARFASEEAQGAYKIDPYRGGPSGGPGPRLADIQAKVDASPYKDVKDSPAVTHTFEMVQAKLAGYVLPVDVALAPLSREQHIGSGALCQGDGLSAPAAAAKALAEDRQPDPGGAQQSLFLRSAGADLSLHGRPRTPFPPIRRR